MADPTQAPLDFVPALRGALRAAGYDYAGVAERLGPVAHAALGRNETTPGLRWTRSGDPLDVLIRLWLLQAPVPLADAERALPGLVDRLCTAGLLERSVGEVAGRLDVRPYAADDPDLGGDLWVVSDLTPGLDGAPNSVGADHVLGISPAATSLAELTVRRPASRALDLGTGSGVQALHLTAHCDHVVGTDVNPRALRIARLNAALNEVDLDLREGSLYAPVGGEAFDLVVSNPPFVISPATGDRLVYRDSGLPGDEIVERVVRGARDHLTDGGIAQVLANWVIERDRPWDERLTDWLDGLDAWIVQREVLDPAAYVELWLKDAGTHGAPDYPARYDAWLAWFERQHVEAVGFGWITLRRTDATSHVRCEEWPYEVEQPLGVEAAAYLDRADLLRDLAPDDVRGLRLRCRADVVQETEGDPGAEDPRVVVLRQRRGLRRARRVSTAEAALVGAADGELIVGQLLDAVEVVTGETLAADVVPSLLEEGFLESAATLPARGR